MATRHDWTPTLLLSAFTGILAYAAAAQAVASRYQPTIDGYEWEIRPFEARFAAEPRSSQYLEEWLIRDFFGDRRDGTFLDVGAYHYQALSNTYYLEKVLGWSGLAIEPQTEFAADYAAFRPRTRFVAMFASDVDDGQATLFVPSTAPYGASATQHSDDRGVSAQATVVPTTTLNRVLEQAGIERIDFVTMDIELHEPQALAGFDIARYRPALVCIEAHRHVRQPILEYFHRHGYVLVGKYLRADLNNLYFMPAAAGH